MGRPKVVEGIRVLQEGQKARVIYTRPDLNCLALRLPGIYDARRQALKTGMFLRCFAIDHRPTDGRPGSMWIRDCDNCPGAVKMRGTKSGRYAYKVKSKVMVNKRTGERRVWRGSVVLV